MDISRRDRRFFNGATTLQPWILRNRWPSRVGKENSSMGPRLFSRGYIEDARDEIEGCSLQWGHDSSAVDTTDACDMPHPPHFFNGATTLQPWIPHTGQGVDHSETLFNGATTLQPWILQQTLRCWASEHLSSMGPRLFSRGYAGGRLRYRITSVSSMGPRLFSRGYLMRSAQGAGFTCSSMGPRLFSRGYGEPPRPPALPAPLQWGHDSSAVDTARVKRLRYHSMVFNGATTLQPWIQIYCAPTGHAHAFFNGATTLQPWILTYRQQCYLCGLLLQWGHDSSAVDTSQARIASSRPISSSMGPRLFSRGYPVMKYLWIETFAIFNGATTLQPWIQAIGDLPSVRHGSSMGPRLFSRGYYLQTEMGKLSEWVFNGATTLQPWIPDYIFGVSLSRPNVFNGATTLQPWILDLDR